MLGLPGLRSHGSAASFTPGNAHPCRIVPAQPVSALPRRRAQREQGEFNPSDPRQPKKGEQYPFAKQTQTNPGDEFRCVPVWGSGVPLKAAGGKRTPSHRTVGRATACSYCCPAWYTVLRNTGKVVIDKLVNGLLARLIIHSLVTEWTRCLTTARTTTRATAS